MKVSGTVDHIQKAGNATNRPGCINFIVTLLQTQLLIDPQSHLLFRLFLVIGALRRLALRTDRGNFWKGYGIRILFIGGNGKVCFRNSESYDQHVAPSATRCGQPTNECDWDIRDGYS